MTTTMRSRRELDEWLDSARRAGRRVGLVPTMGALHAGHASLVAASRAETDATVLSIFVNPLQFDRPADLARYPRDPEGDASIAAELGVEVVFAPDDDEMYPAGAPVITVDAGPLGAVLEGASRPGHFRGVATVVTKLLAIVGPARAYFGEKDYQQLVLVRRLVADLSFPTTVVGCPTVREADGLALSSRNRRLGDDDRAVAATLARSLRAGADAFRAGRDVAATRAFVAALLEENDQIEVDYVEVCTPDLGEPGPHDDVVRILVAGSVGDVRLIDNLEARR